jgi:hypothetical protein
MANHQQVHEFPLNRYQPNWDSFVFLESKLICKLNVGPKLSMTWIVLGILNILFESFKVLYGVF